MDFAIFVQNINYYCKTKGVPPTVACRESGAGSSFIANIRKGQTPSVEKVQQLATYLDCTVSDLLGEAPPGDKKMPTTEAAYSPEAQRIAAAFDAASEKDKTVIRAVLGI